MKQQVQERPAPFVVETAGAPATLAPTGAQTPAPPIFGDGIVGTASDEKVSVDDDASDCSDSKSRSRSVKRNNRHCSKSSSRSRTTQRGQSGDPVHTAPAARLISAAVVNEPTAAVVDDPENLTVNRTGCVPQDSVSVPAEEHFVGGKVCISFVAYAQNADPVEQWKLLMTTNNPKSQDSEMTCVLDGRAATVNADGEARDDLAKERSDIEKRWDYMFVRLLGEKTDAGHRFFLSLKKEQIKRVQVRDRTTPPNFGLDGFKFTEAAIEYRDDTQRLKSSTCLFFLFSR